MLKIPQLTLMIGLKETLKKAGVLDLVKKKIKGELLILHHPMKCGERQWMF